MDATRFDLISKSFAQRRLSRRQTLVTGMASLAAGTLAAAAGDHAGVAQEATPTSDFPPQDAEHGPTMLFVQTYQSGTIAPVEGIDGRYTLTLEAGAGQTVYFSDRPDRIVGATDTSQFLEGLGFSEENPPNAALVVETAPGETDVAVLELFSPLYSPVSQTVSYDIEVLANWQDELEMGLHEAPTDLAALAPSFGAAHLFIDDCDNDTMYCVPKQCEYNTNVNGDLGKGHCAVFGQIDNSEHDGFCYSFWGSACLPCFPWFQTCVEAIPYWNNFCNWRFPDCNGNCRIFRLTPGQSGSTCGTQFSL